MPLEDSWARQRAAELTPVPIDVVEGLEVVVTIVDHCEVRLEPLRPAYVTILRASPSRSALPDHDANKIRALDNR
eukprot:SAG31_NODE_21252_length_554_cov_0.786813_2_plen_75_part_00